MMATALLENRLAELLMSALMPCDLGDGIEVVHDVEDVEVEMSCALEDDDWDNDVTDVDSFSTIQFARVAEDVGTHRFVRFSAPYERIELELDRSFLRATIEDAKTTRRLAPRVRPRG